VSKQEYFSNVHNVELYQIKYIFIFFRATLCIAAYAIGAVSASLSFRLAVTFVYFVSVSKR